MGRKMRAAAAALLALGLTAPALQASPSPTANDEQSFVSALGEAAGREDCPAIMTLLDGRFRRDDLARVPLPVLSQYVQLGWSCAQTLENDGHLGDWVARAVALGARDRDLLYLHLKYSFEADHLEETLRTLALLRDSDPEGLNRANLSWLARVDDRLKEKSLTNERLTLLALISAESFAPHETLGRADYFLRRFAMLLAEQGRKAEAGAIVARVRVPEVLIEFSFDPVMSALMPKDFDPRAATQAYLEQARKALRDNPDRLEAVIWVAQSHRALGQPQEALATLMAARQRKGGLAAFVDAVTELNWWWNELAYVHEALNQYDEQISAMQRGARTQEDGGDNISQLLNLAHAQLEAGRPADARETLKTFENDGLRVSDYGALVFRFNRGCAAHLMGETAIAEEDLAFTLENVTDERWRMAYRNYLCRDRLDEAAATLIAHLEDATSRAEVLRRLADYDPPPVPRPESLSERWKRAMKARPDVLAALRRYGGPHRIHLQEPD